MNKSRTVVATVALVLLAFGGGGTAPAATITVLHVNDTHSHLDATGPKTRSLEGTVGGIAKAASVIAAERRHDPNLLLLHAGDAFVGDLLFNAYFGVPELQLMQQLGFDAMAVGNHEFDLGPDALAYALGQAYGGGTLPLLSANLDLSAKPELATWIKPSTTKDVNGVRVGIFGMTVPDEPTMNSAPVAVIGGDAMFGIAGAQVQALRASGAQVVICLSHLGVLYDQALAANVPGIDVIVGGHNHYEYARPLRVTNPGGTRTLIVQAGQFYEKVGRLRLVVADGAVTFKDYALLPVDASVRSLPAVQQVVRDLKTGVVAQFGDVYHTVLARALRDIDRTAGARSPARDSGMGDLITDSMRWAAHTDIAITTDGLISEGITAGPIVGADAFRPVSYGFDPATGLGFKLVTFDITGAEMVKGIETTLAYLGLTDAFSVEVSGMRFAYDAAAPLGGRVCLSSIRIGGRRFDPAATYSATADEGLVMLLPLMGVAISNPQVLPDHEYTALRDFLTRLRLVDYASEGRVVDLAAWRLRCAGTDGAADVPALPVGEGDRPGIEWR